MDNNQISIETTYIPDPTVPENFTEVFIKDGEITHIDAGPYNGFLQGSLKIYINVGKWWSRVQAFRGLKDWQCFCLTKYSFSVHWPSNQGLKTQIRLDCLQLHKNTKPVNHWNQIKMTRLGPFTYDMHIRKVLWFLDPLPHCNINLIIYLRKLPIMTSAKFLGFWAPHPLSAFWPQIQY